VDGGDQAGTTYAAIFMGHAVATDAQLHVADNTPRFMVRGAGHAKKRNRPRNRPRDRGG
jgi:hypothetical protein